jgi:signal transduction histidine kinase
LFQRFHADEEIPGTGIGLALVKKSVEMLNGEITAESVVGKGTCFSIKLPLAEPPAALETEKREA